MADDAGNGANTQDNSEEIETDVGEDSATPSPTSGISETSEDQIEAALDLTARERAIQRAREELERAYNDFQITLPPTQPPDKGPHKRKVAYYITLALLGVFVLQALVFTLSYVILVYEVYEYRGTNAEEMEQVTEAILQGVQVILPVTTTLLGVAIGFYFKEESEEAEAEEAEQETIVI